KNFSLKSIRFLFYIFAKNKVDPKTAFKTIRSANHDANILAIANKQLDASVFSSDTLALIEARQPEVAKKISIIWKSPLIAADPLVWKKDLPVATKEKIKDFFITYGKTGANVEQEKAQLTKLKYSGFKESNNAQLKPVRQLELFKDKSKIETDDKLSAEDKKTKLDDIARKLTELAKA
ncbi:MAG: PhnD/SsuA/transferrin family substrate-binding protein, partial [Glaciimonas sp.]|nr:PhnD/SsuA/transferrin family substrate-binding protein [Glaciimonas sp.]